MKTDQEHDEQNKQFLTVGLGASAGGVEALKAFFNSLPEETGMAFIVILHLSPDHESKMAELLQLQTSLEVLQVDEKVEIKPEHVYVIPPNKLLSVGDNHLELSKPEKEHGLASIDLFFRSLAQTKGEHSACIILSGTGNDGTTGIKDVKEAGGLTIAQDPEEAQYSGMPQHAIETKLVDFVLPVAQIAEELINYKKGLSSIRISDEGDEEEQALQKIFERVRSETGHDFSNYKRSSVLRRMERRIQVNMVNGLSAYYAFIQKHPEEVHELFKDLLISVTNFFRDPEAFDKLKETVIPKLFEKKDRDEQLRVWIPGCATGEEAYSVAILLREHAQTVEDPPQIKVFASDIDKEALNVGRAGRYPESIIADVSSERLDRHFIKDGPEYEIRREVKDMVLFAKHDLLRNPPFSNQDLIACRNLLIYLNRELQSEVFNLFHYTLRNKGYLFLGMSDSNQEASELFNSVNKQYRIFQRRPTAQSNLRLPKTTFRFADTRSSLSTPKRSHRKSNFETLHRDLLTQLYAPESVIINGNYEVLHATDNIGKYLEYSGGEPSHDIMEMITPELRQPMRNLLYEADKKGKRPLTKRTLYTPGDGLTRQLDLIVHPIRESEFSEELIQIVFKEVKTAPRRQIEIQKRGEDEVPEEANEIISSLEEELQYTKEQLQVTVEEYETSNEELRASNEELQSMNEELQSTTEELETSQEELQSVNEELKTVNQELENKVEKLDRANSDLKNLMENADMGIVFVDRNFCVQRFTDSSKELFNLISSDKGRPISHITHSLEYESLVEDIKYVHEKLKRIKKIIHSRDGRWYIMRIRPYRSTEDKIEGVVLTFVEFTQLKEARETIREQSYQQTLATLGVYALEQGDVQMILKRAIDLACINLGLDCAVIYALNKEQNTYEISEQAGCAKEGSPEDINKKSDVGIAFGNDEPTIVTSYNEEKRFGLSPFLQDEAIESSIHIVVRGSEDTYGLLGFYSYEQRDFNECEVDFLQIVANIVGMAIERHQAKEKLKQEVAKSEQYQREILNSNISERWRLGRYLHDNLGQILAAAKIVIEDLEQKQSEPEDRISRGMPQIKAMIDEGISGIRNLAHDIIPVDVEEEGFSHALRLLLRQSQKIHDVKCTLEAEEVIKDIKNLKAATHLYHITQEAIKNAAIHGKAENVQIHINKEEDYLQLQIRDDGVGLSKSSSPNNGKGLRIIGHRVDLMGGTYDIEEVPDSEGTGTRLTVTIPLSKLVREQEEDE